MKVLITGGAGFIGTHAVKRFASRGQVIALDNLSRKGSESNLEWLSSQCRFDHRKIDIRDAAAVEAEVKRTRPDLVIHLAAQVAVTSSVVNPREDFEINATGTLNVLEAVRRQAPGAALIYSSTNKVYGGMEEQEVVLKGERYAYGDAPHGIDESSPLDFHSPYGCSKGCADQYVRDYHRIYGLKTVVFRQSCIYGTRQFGVEDQGWVAWFTICAITGRPVCIYGDGKQVRDLLWVEDLLDAIERSVDGINRTAGRIYNIGGGPEFQMSLRESLATLEKLHGARIPHSFSDWRPGDQKVFVADTRLAQKELGWKPKVSPKEGVEQLYRWVSDNRELFGATKIEQPLRKAG